MKDYIVYFIDGIKLAVKAEDREDAQEQAIMIMETANRKHDSIKSIRRMELPVEPVAAGIVF